MLGVAVMPDFSRSLSADPHRHRAFLLTFTYHRANASSWPRGLSIRLSRVGLGEQMSRRTPSSLVLDSPFWQESLNVMAKKFAPQLPFLASV